MTLLSEVLSTAIYSALEIIEFGVCVFLKICFFPISLCQLCKRSILCCISGSRLYEQVLNNSNKCKIVYNLHDALYICFSLLMFHALFLDSGKIAMKMEPSIV